MKRFISLLLFGITTFVAFVLVVNIFIQLSTWRYIYPTASRTPPAEAVLILGAPLLPGGAPSSIFIDRADAAIAVYQEGRASKILISGDGTTPVHDEVTPIRRYLIDHGIPETDILLDHAGLDTYSSLYRAQHSFRISSLIIATQSFHLPRALFIAHWLGLEAYGVNADVGRILPRNYIRELFSDEKALLDLLFHIHPQEHGGAVE